jgi:hypothetical protein
MTVADQPIMVDADLDDVEDRWLRGFSKVQVIPYSVTLFLSGRTSCLGVAGAFSLV